MAYDVYILHSQELDRYYVGFSESRRRRLKQHLRGGEHWTIRASDWVEIWHQRVDTRAEARALEKRIKGRGPSRFLEAVGTT